MADEENPIPDGLGANDIWARVVGGDPVATGEVYRVIDWTIRRVAPWTPDHDREEVRHDAICRLYEASARQEIRNWRSLLVTITQNLLHDRSRRRATLRRALASLPVGAEEQPSDPSEPNARSLSAALRMVERLPSVRQRVLVKLHFAYACVCAGFALRVELSSEEAVWRWTGAGPTAAEVLVSVDAERKAFHTWLAERFGLTGPNAQNTVTVAVRRALRELAGLLEEAEENRSWP